MVDPSSLTLVVFSFLATAAKAVPLSSKNSTAVHSVSSFKNATLPTASATGNLTTPTAAVEAAAALNPKAVDCKIALPANALTAEGLSTPWELLPPCSQSVTGQQAFAEAAVIDSSGKLSIYHPLVIDQGKKPAVAPVVPNLGADAQVALFFGFNGNTLTLVDTQGKDSNSSPSLAASKCVNGLPGTKGDVFGQVSWCNTDAFWNAANAAVSSGKLQVPPLGNNNNGGPCLSTRSFEIIDQDQSDNLPTRYLLLPDKSTVQFTAANQKKFPQATEIDNASDEALIADFVDPVIGCTPFKVPSLDDPGAMVSSLASQELQALHQQKAPIALVPLNNPDTLLTKGGGMSPDKTNAYRIGVNMPPLGTGANTDAGSPTEYCNNLVSIQPPFLAGFQKELTAATTPDAGVGNSLFTFLANRFVQSLTNLNCPNKNIPVKCQLDGNGAATSCTITVQGGNAGGNASSKSITSNLASSSAFTATATHSRKVKTHNFGTTTVASNGHTRTAAASTTSNDRGASSPTPTATAEASKSNKASNTSQATRTEKQPSASGAGASASATSLAVHDIDTSTPTITSSAPAKFTLEPSAKSPPPLTQFTSVATSAAVAAMCTSTLSRQDCWSIAGWQLCRLE